MPLTNWYRKWRDAGIPPASSEDKLDRVNESPAPAEWSASAGWPLSALHIVESSARAFQRDLYFYWSTVRANPLSLTRENRLYKRDLKLVNAALLHQAEIGPLNEPDLPRLLFLRLLLTDLGLLRKTGTAIQAVERPAFLERSPAERIRQCLNHWREGAFWNEVLSIPNLTVLGAGPRHARAPAKLAASRMSVVEYIAAQHRHSESHADAASDNGRAFRDPETHWTPIARLIERIRADDYDFLLPRDYSSLQSIYYRAYDTDVSHISPYIMYGNEMGWSFSPQFRNQAEGWSVVEAGFIRAILLEPMHWMGLVDIGYIAGPPVGGTPVGGTPADGDLAAAGAIPVAYRLTPVGAWMLGVGPEVDMPDEQGRIVVQPNFELFALDPISDMTLAQLDEFAERMSAERAIKYRLTRESVYRAQKRGWTAERIIQVMGTLASALNQPSAADQPTGATSLPQNIVRTLQEWQGLHERVTIHRRGSLLQAANADLLAQLRQEADIRSHLLHPGDPGAAAGEPEEKASADAALALISPALGETEELVRALERAGYPPLRTRSPRAPILPSLTLIPDDEGSAAGLAVRFHVALPSIYLYEQIAPLTGQDERGRYYITPSTVQEAMRGGMSVPDILDLLGAFHRGPLPHAAVKQIRAWGHYYGDAAVQTVTLIQIQDGKTLNELLAEPEIHALVRPFVPDPARALAMVDTRDLEKLYEVLARYGIDIRGQLAQAALVPSPEDE